MNNPSPDDTPPVSLDKDGQKNRSETLALSIGAMGVVFGDIGTSPIYTLRECFVQTGLSIDALTIYGFLSLIFWALTIVVTFKYATMLLQANNRGEGGSMALAALALYAARKKKYLQTYILTIAIAGVALFYGDGMITPAMSVISAVEGLEIISPSFGFLVTPLAILILIGLFMVQSFGTRALGRISGPVMLVWFLTLGVMGLYHIVDQPQVMLALNPLYAVEFFMDHFALSGLVLGAVVLCVTGAEGLYSDLGHFGQKPIRLGWLYIVYPCLVLNYYGQGALLVSNPGTLESPFFHMVAPWLLIPLVILTTLATVIASQAVITGAYSLTQQAIQLGLLPRMRILHTDDDQRGQIFVPRVNTILLIGVVLLALNFRSSSALAHMYGLAVTGTMLANTMLLVIVMKRLWRRTWLFTIAIGGLFLVVDVCFFGANMMKLAEGGWVPLTAGALVFAAMTTWKRGRDILVEKRRQVSMSVAEFMKMVREEEIVRVPGTAVYLAYVPNVAPYPLLHNVEHNKVLHERVVLLTIRTEDRPKISDHERVILGEEGEGVWHMVVRYGFTEEPRVLSALAIARRQGFDITVSNTTFFIGRDHLVMFHKPIMARWRMALFFFMAHTSTSASDYFKLPRARVMEIGAQIDM